ncbi:GDSL-type esterase/lipase family protein [Candidatus Neomarinimicrobiota bacterium]
MRIKYKNLFQILILAGITIIQAQQIRVACVGNSITAGAWLTNPAEDSYPGVLANLLGSDYNVKNFGYSASTVLKNSDSPYWNKPSYQFALGFFPDVVIIMFGTNDSRPENWIFSDQFESDYIALIESFLLKNPYSKFILCFPPSIRNDLAWDTILRTEVIPKIASIASQTGSKVIKLYEHFRDHEELYLDEIHPNQIGYQVIANAVFQAIKTIEDTQAPEIPTNFSALGFDRSIRLTWSQNSEADMGSYVLFKNEKENVEPKYFRNVIWSNTVYTDYAVVNGDSFYYKIAAMDLSGNISNSSAIKLAVPKDKKTPVTPTIVSISVELGKVVLQWEQNIESDLKHYNIYRSSDYFTPTEPAYKIGTVLKPNSVFYDTLLASHTEYFYGVTAVDSSGNESNKSDFVTAYTLNISEKELADPELILTPNPFNSTIRFRYYLSDISFVRINIFDVFGRDIYTVVDEVQSTGSHHAIWDAKNSNGIPVSAGLYLYSYEDDRNIYSGKLIYLK